MWQQLGSLERSAEARPRHAGPILQAKEAGKEESPPTVGSPFLGGDLSRNRGGASEARGRSRRLVGGGQNRERVTPPHCGLQPETCGCWYLRGGD